MTARELTPAQRRALLLRRCGLPWRMVYAVAAYNRLWPNRHIDGDLQRMIGRAVERAAAL